MKNKTKLYDASLAPVRSVYFIVLTLLKLIAIILLRGKVKRDPAIKHLQGPVIAIGNHPSFIDPVYMAMVFWPRHVHFVTSSTFFRIAFFRHILQASRTIPKVQFRTDTQAAKNMLRVIHKKGVLGIYPEGQRSLDGSLHVIDSALPKFIKKTGCSIVVIKVHGAYLSWPRWSESWLRLGKIKVDSQVLLSADEIRHINEATLGKKLISALSYNDYKWQQNQKIRYFSVAPASGLHNLCHRCPACSKDLVMRTKFTQIHCSSCGFAMKINLYGFLKPLPPHEQLPDLPDTPYAWHRWQINELIKSFKTNGYLLRQSAEMQIADAVTGKFRRLCRGDISFDEKGLVFTSHSNEPVCLKRFPVLNRGGIIADFGTYFQLVMADEVYRFLPDNGQSVILFADAIYAMQDTVDH